MTETYDYILMFENNAESTLAGDYTAGQTTMTITDVSDFPDPTGSYDAFRCIIYDDTNEDFFYVTDVTGSVFTLPQLANSYDEGAKIELRLDAETLKSFVQKGNYRTVTNDPEEIGADEAIYFGEEVMYNDGEEDIWYKDVGGTWERVTGAVA